MGVRPLSAPCIIEQHLKVNPAEMIYFYFVQLNRHIPLSAPRRRPPNADENWVIFLATEEIQEGNDETFF